MMLSLVVVIVAGIGVAAGTDELLRGRDPRSRRVIVAGIIGAIAAVIARRAMGVDGALVDALTAFFGAGLLAFATRAHTSAALARVAPWGASA